ncbi:hypothetical protein LSH36_32g21058 [Paralvinella palmiformis]|uniref:Vacuolar protein sorting-associated protein 11 homolog n=1 Tax=Paralvinella palmiformis TaxID=53620 RepID=A0AAD9K9N1_9ANNE|nr:hypothetical protein LSH36_32g21058 [Paralvinella palmiformis]
MSFLQSIDISATASGRGQLIFGDHDGNLHFIDRDLQMSSFKAYILRVTHLYQLKQHNILITVGNDYTPKNPRDDDEGINPLIKVWNLDKIDRSGQPLCSRIVRAVPGNRPTKVTCINAHENLNYMAVGFENGCILLFKGDITKERHSKSRILYESAYMITGIEFKTHTSGKPVIMFVSTLKEVICFNLLPKDRDVKTVLDQHGCPVHCSVMSDISQDNQFVIGRQDAVYFYQPDGRGPCLAFEGDKLRIHWYRGYLVLVSKEVKPSSLIGNVQSPGVHIITVYDIQNKLIAYSGPLPEVTDVLCDWGGLYVLTGDNRLHLLQEKDTQTKLEILFKKNLYHLAISLAQSQQYDQDGIIDIFRQYGDHLYGKGDHDGAIQQYIKTIGKLEASYVIRKTEGRDVDFDVQTAIRVCRQAGYYKHALFLSEHHQQHDWYLKIQLEDIKDYDKALKYIGKLNFPEAEHNLKTYGKILMAEVPMETTELLKRLCTDYKPSDKPLVDAANLDGGAPTVKRANPDEFIHIFVNNHHKHDKLTEFLEHMIKVQPNSSVLIYNTLVELYLQACSHEMEISARVEKERKTLDLLQNPESHYDLDQALVLCQMYNFKAGILYQQIVQYHMDHGEYMHIIETCKRFGQQDPNLWIQALAYFSGKEEDCKQQIIEVLSHIDDRNLLPPLLVIQTLAHNSTATLAVVKDYIVRRLQQENDQIQEDERLIEQYRTDTEKMRTQINELKTSAKLFQVSKCSICCHPLDLPSVHFLCQHSYHQHCFESYAEHEAECPVCLPENRKILDIIRAQEQSRDLHEQFHHQLERAQDGFSVIADYFGRGVFNKMTLITDRSATKSSLRQPPRPPPRKC